MLPEELMRAALVQAQIALSKNEVPVGAVVVKDGQIIGRGHNLRHTNNDPFAHAEILAMQQAAKHLGDWRLSDCTLYVTLEPCPMCAGAAYQARVGKIVYAAADLVAGALGGYFNLYESLPSPPQTFAGLLANEGQAMLKDFFQTLRQ